MSENRIFRLKPALRLEWRGQHGKNKPDQRDHRTNLSDSIVQETRIGFSVHAATSERHQRMTGAIPQCAPNAPLKTRSAKELRSLGISRTLRCSGKSALSP